MPSPVFHWLNCERDTKRSEHIKAMLKGFPNQRHPGIGYSWPGGHTTPTIRGIWDATQRLLENIAAGNVPAIYMEDDVVIPWDRFWPAWSEFLLSGDDCWMLSNGSGLQFITAPGARKLC